MIKPMLDRLAGALQRMDDGLAGIDGEVLRVAHESHEQDVAWLRGVHLDALPADDEVAIAQLVQIKGIGRWSAGIWSFTS